MIIPCPNCNRKFKIDNSLIPNEGRDLQCGLCNHFWFYKKIEDNTELLELKDEITLKDLETDIVKKKDERVITSEIIETEIKEEKKVKISEQKKNIAQLSKINNKDTGSRFFSYLIVFIISLIVLVILLDTLKTPLIHVFPGIEIILFNLFETLQDIKLFIIALI